MEVRKEALNPGYTFSELLCTNCILYDSPNYVVLATKQIYQGVQQFNKSQEMYIVRVRLLFKDAFDLASRYSMNKVFLIIITVVEGLSNTTLATMVSSYVGQVPFLFNAFRDTIG